MKKDNKYYDFIESKVRSHRRFPGCEAVLEEIIDDIYAHSEVVINSIQNESVVKTYIEKLVASSIITVSKRYNINKDRGVQIRDIRTSQPISARTPVQTPIEPEPAIVEEDKSVQTENIPEKEPQTGTRVNTEYVDNMINSIASDSVNGQESIEELQTDEVVLEDSDDVLIEELDAIDDTSSQSTFDSAEAEELVVLDNPVQEEDDDLQIISDYEESGEGLEEESFEIEASDLEETNNGNFEEPEIDESSELSVEPLEQKEEVFISEDELDIEETPEIQEESVEQTEEMLVSEESDEEDLTETQPELMNQSEELFEESEDFSTEELIETADEPTLQNEDEEPQFEEVQQIEEEPLEQYENTVENDVQENIDETEMTDESFEEEESDTEDIVELVENVSAPITEDGILEQEDVDMDSVDLSAENNNPVFEDNIENDYDKTDKFDLNDSETEEFSNDVYEPQNDDFTNDIEIATEDAIIVPEDNEEFQLQEESFYKNFDLPEEPIESGIGELGQDVPNDDFTVDGEDTEELTLSEEVNDDIIFDDSAESITLHSEEYSSDIADESGSEVLQDDDTELDFHPLNYSVFDYNSDNTQENIEPELDSLPEKLIELNNEYPTLRILSIFECKYKKNMSVDEISSALNMEKEDIIQALNELVGIV